MKKIFLIGAAVIALPFLSCEDEEIITVDVPRIVEVEASNNDDNSTDTNDPTDDLSPDFSFTNEGNVFSLTNLTQGASELLWFFGDSSTLCNTENPTYTFGSEGGEIDVTLRASNNIGETFESTQTLTAPELVVAEATITIDGTFDDWTAVDNLIDDTNVTGGTMKKLKVLAEGSTINMYLEGNETMLIEVVDMFINTDVDTTTGFLHTTWPDASGADILYEGPLTSNSGSFFDYIGVDGAWGWLPKEESVVDLVSSGVVAIDASTNAIEFSFPSSQLGTLGESISIAITELASWSPIGNLPAATGFAVYTFPGTGATEATISCD